jgi:hypothetical protein
MQPKKESILKDIKNQYPLNKMYYPSKNTSQEFKKKFLLKFTKQLIIASNEEYSLKIIEKEKLKKLKKREEELIKENKRLTKETKLQERIRKEKELRKNIRKEATPIKKQFVKKPQFKPLKQAIIKKQLNITPKTRIPEYQLPINLQYLKPTITNREINLGKINPFISDQMVREIECNGPGKPLIVKGAMGVKNTAISLTKEEIEQVFETFSNAAKIPVHEGVVKVVAGRLILSAIISELIDSRFIIKKMIPQLNQMRNPYARR